MQYCAMNLKTVHSSLTNHSQSEVSYFKSCDNIYCRFTADEPDHVTFKAKLWSTDAWYPSAEEDPIELLMYDRYEKQCQPQGN